jgi:hypothetical protein
MSDSSATTLFDQKPDTQLQHQRDPLKEQVVSTQYAAGVVVGCIFSGLGVLGFLWIGNIVAPYAAVVPFVLAGVFLILYIYYKYGEK